MIYSIGVCFCSDPCVCYHCSGVEMVSFVAIYRDIYNTTCENRTEIIGEYVELSESRSKLKHISEVAVSCSQMWFCVGNVAYCSYYWCEMQGCKGTVGIDSAIQFSLRWEEAKCNQCGINITLVFKLFCEAFRSRF